MGAEYSEENINNQISQRDQIIGDLFSIAAPYTASSNIEPLTEALAKMPYGRAIFGKAYRKALNYFLEISTQLNEFSHERFSHGELIGNEIYIDTPTVEATPTSPVAAIEFNKSLSNLFNARYNLNDLSFQTLDNVLIDLAKTAGLNATFMKESPYIHALTPLALSSNIKAQDLPGTKQLNEITFNKSVISEGREFALYECLEIAAVAWRNDKERLARLPLYHVHLVGILEKTAKLPQYDFIKEAITNPLQFSNRELQYGIRNGSRGFTRYDISNDWQVVWNFVSELLQASLEEVTNTSENTELEGQGVSLESKLDTSSAVFLKYLMIDKSMEIALVRGLVARSRDQELLNLSDCIDVLRDLSAKANRFIDVVRETQSHQIIWLSDLVKVFEQIDPGHVTANELAAVLVELQVQSKLDKRLRTNDLSSSANGGFAVQYSFDKKVDQIPTEVNCRVQLVPESQSEKRPGKATKSPLNEINIGRYVDVRLKFRTPAESNEPNNNIAKPILLEILKFNVKVIDDKRLDNFTAEALLTGIGSIIHNGISRLIVESTNRLAQNTMQYKRSGPTAEHYNTDTLPGNSQTLTSSTSRLAPLPNRDDRLKSWQPSRNQTQNHLQNQPPSQAQNQEEISQQINLDNSHEGSNFNNDQKDLFVKTPSGYELIINYDNILSPRNQIKMADITNAQAQKLLADEVSIVGITELETILSRFAHKISIFDTQTITGLPSWLVKTNIDMSHSRTYRAVLVNINSKDNIWELAEIFVKKSSKESLARYKKIANRYINYKR